GAELLARGERPDLLGPRVPLPSAAQWSQPDPPGVDVHHVPHPTVPHVPCHRADFDTGERLPLPSPFRGHRVAHVLSASTASSGSSASGAVGTKDGPDAARTGIGVHQKPLSSRPSRISAVVSVPAALA